MLSWLFDITKYGIVPDSGLEAEVEIKGNRVAVLPFSDLSENKKDKHYADGIADVVLRSLTGNEGTEVISRVSSFRYNSTCI